MIIDKKQKVSLVIDKQNFPILTSLTIATKTILSTQNWFFFFFFFAGKNLLLHVATMKKVADRGFLAFWPFENEQNFRKSVKMLQKI